MTLFSKRNQITVATNGQSLQVEKRFQTVSDWQREWMLYQKFTGNLPVPQLYKVESGLLVMEYLPLPTMLNVLESQEEDGFQPEPWTALGKWVRQCHMCSDMVPGDGNLRNFLWDEKEKQCVGLDFEEYCSGTLAEAGARLIGFLLEYTPKGTSAKAAAAHVLQADLQTSDGQIDAVRRELKKRRAIIKVEKSL